MQARGATKGVFDENNLLTSRVFQCGINNGCPTITALLPHSVKSKLIQHLARQISFPEIAILSIQNGFDLAIAQHEKIRTKRWRAMITGIIGRIVVEHSAQYSFILNLVTD